jgi:hypothetical protein
MSLRGVGWKLLAVLAMCSLLLLLILGAVLLPLLG